MSRTRVARVVGLLAFVLPGFVAAQGLGDAAARERAKRQAAKKADEAKVFTNDDLAQGRPPGTPSADGAASSSPSSPSSPPEGARPEAAPEESSPPDPRTEEQPYVEAVNAAKARVAQVEARIKELQARLNPMSTTFIYGDFNGLGGNKIAEEAEVKAELAQAEAELNAARQEVAEAARARDGFRQGRPTAPPVPQ